MGRKFGYTSQLLIRITLEATAKSEQRTFFSIENAWAFVWDHMMLESRSSSIRY